MGNQEGLPQGNRDTTVARESDFISNSRSPSTTIPQNTMEDMYSELLVELECPICTEYMTPPIRQCSTGHSICGTCRARLPRCPLCQGEFTEAKNLSLEALARKMHYPCQNRDSGCNVRLTFDERSQHEAVCQYKGFKCGMDKCGWTGKKEEIEAHWASKAAASRPYVADNVCHTKLKPNCYFVNLVKAHDSLFWFKCKVANGTVYWTVQYIGSNDDARTYFYEIEIIKCENTRCRALLSDYCHEMGTENAELFKEGKSSSMSLEALNKYVGEDQLLIYYMRVRAGETDDDERVESATGGLPFERKAKVYPHRGRSRGGFHKGHNHVKQHEVPKYKGGRGQYKKLP